MTQSDCDFVYDLYIAEIFRPGIYFILLLTVWTYLSSFSCTQRKSWSSSFKFTKIGTNRKPVSNVLLVFHIVTKSSILSKIKRVIGRKSAFLDVFTHFELSQAGVPLWYRVHNLVSKKSLGCPTVKPRD